MFIARGAGNINTGTGVYQNSVSVQVPAGTYLLIGTGEAYNGDGDFQQGDCRLLADGATLNGTFVDREGHQGEFFAFQEARTFSATTNVELKCVGFAMQGHNFALTATQVSSLG